MKLVSKILLRIGMIVLIALIVALFLSNTYVVKKSITINQPKTEIFNYIKYLKNQNEYSKWAKMDTGMQKVFSGTDATTGFLSA